MSGDPRRPVLGFFGAALMALGGLICVLSGLCTGLGVIATIMNAVRFPASQGHQGDFLGLVLVVGVPPIALGLILFFIGQLISRAAK